MVNPTPIPPPPTPSCDSRSCLIWLERRVYERKQYTASAFNFSVFIFFCKAQWKGEEDKVDRKRGGRTPPGNGQGWSSPSPRGQWRTEEKKWRKLVVKSSVVPQRAPQIRHMWRRRCELFRLYKPLHVKQDLYQTVGLRYKSCAFSSMDAGC